MKGMLIAATIIMLIRASAATGTVWVSASTWGWTGAWIGLSATIVGFSIADASDTYRRNARL